ncbi:MAG TPA: YdcF family protein [Terracidiphilus sp.]|nr:YdcF family protein [Terracidiphilus sp.]
MSTRNTSGAAGAKPLGRWAIGAVVCLIVVPLMALAWFLHLYTEIEQWAAIDQAAPSDAIAVFGAAEYDGRPSPVYRARLDHADSLWEHGIAPMIVTLGGPGGDQYSEGGVGRTYLMSLGVPESAIIAETHSRSTVEAVDRLVVIARANGFKRLVVVSDEAHMFRLHAICTAEGLRVLTSPRAPVPVEGGTSKMDPIVHEMLSYTAWRLHLE